MESDLSPKDKCNLIDYVKEAQWDEILNLVFNGSPPTRKLTINEQYILEAQAENFIYPLILRYMTERKKTSSRKERQQARTAKEKGMPYDERLRKAKIALKKKAKREKIGAGPTPTPRPKTEKPKTERPKRETPKAGAGRRGN